MKSWDVMKRKINKKYDYKVFWSEEDQEYVATCDEFPSLSWLSECPIQALCGIVGLTVVPFEGVEKETEE